MKAYTDIEQSNMLAEILPLESADMSYRPYREIGGMPDYQATLRPYKSAGWAIPCWSTAALLDIIRNNGRYELQMHEGGYYFEFCLGSSNFMTKTYLNSVDACYEMILKLHGLKILGYEENNQTI